MFITLNSVLENKYLVDSHFFPFVLNLKFLSAGISREYLEFQNTYVNS